MARTPMQMRGLAMANAIRLSDIEFSDPVVAFNWIRLQGTQRTWLNDKRTDIPLGMRDLIHLLLEGGRLKFDHPEKLHRLEALIEIEKTYLENREYLKGVQLVDAGSALQWIKENHGAMQGRTEEGGTVLRSHRAMAHLVWASGCFWFSNPQDTRWVRKLCAAYDFYLERKMEAEVNRVIRVVVYGKGEAACYSDVAQECRTAWQKATGNGFYARIGGKGKISEKQLEWILASVRPEIEKKLERGIQNLQDARALQTEMDKRIRALRRATTPRGIRLKTG